MKNYPLEYKDTGLFSKVLLDYIENNESLHPFYAIRPEIEKIIVQSEHRHFDLSKRELLHSVLKSQNEYLDLSEKSLANLDLLKNENTFTVTTGHQLCLMGGPLYVFLKTISTINATEKLNEATDKYDYVPIFWLASEDHDLDEVDHINLFGRQLKWKAQKGKHVGSMRLEGIAQFNNEIFDVLGNSENALELTRIFKRFYHQGNTLAQATRSLLDHFFGKRGLLILDANDPQLKGSFTEIMKGELIEEKTSKLVKESIEEIGGNFKIQANPSQVNLFYLAENERQKIVKLNGHFNFGDERWEQHNILKALEDKPENFSPNVLMRPLYQEFILPNVAMVGGGGELAYWLELKKMFDYHMINFPALILRNSVLLLDSKSEKIKRDLGISFSDLFKDEEVLVKSFAISILQEDQHLSTEKEQLQHILKTIQDKATSVDKTLERSVEGELKKIINSLEKLEAKMLKAVKNKNEIEIAKIRKLKKALFPKNGLQERYESFIPFFLKYGYAFIDSLSDILDPFSLNFSVLTEE